MDVDWYKSSPDYVIEKWDKYIGIAPTFTPRLSNRYLSWCDLWKFTEINVRDSKYQMSSIIEFIRFINTRGIFAWSLSELIDEFEKITGIDVCEIKTDRYNGLHDLIKIKVEEWKSKEINLREYKLLKILV
jgi:hypothetical protein